MNISKTCAITGHRPHKLPWGEDEQTAECFKFKNALIVEIIRLINDDYDTFLCGMAWGIDIIFGNMVTLLKCFYPHIKLIGVIPFEEQHIKWNESYRDRYFELIEDCDEIVQLSTRYHKDCYKDRNKYLVKNAKHLIAVHDGCSKNSGTHQTIRMARMFDRDITIIDPLVKDHDLQDIIESYPSPEELNDLHNPSKQYKKWFKELIESMEK